MGKSISCGPRYKLRWGKEGMWHHTSYHQIHMRHVNPGIGALPNLVPLKCPLPTLEVNYQSRQLVFHHTQISDRMNLETDQIRGLQVAGARGKVYEAFFATRLTDDLNARTLARRRHWPPMEYWRVRIQGLPHSAAGSLLVSHARFPRQDQGRAPLTPPKPRARSSVIVHSLLEETIIPQIFSWSASHSTPHYSEPTGLLFGEKATSALTAGFRRTFPSSGPPASNIREKSG